jgi:hypothetical protein
MPTLLLEPGATGYRDVDRRQPMPGSILVAVIAGQELDGIVAAVQEAARRPWCPLVLTSRTPPSSKALEVLRLRATRLCAVALSSGEAAPPPAIVRQAVACRRVVNAAEFCGFVGARTGADLRDLLQIVLVDYRAEAVSLRRRARRLGRLSPSQWVTLFDLASGVSLSLHHRLSQEGTAFRLNVAPRTLGAWCNRFLGLDWRESVALGSWEAVCEIALRRQTFVRELPPLTRDRRASGDFVAVHFEEASYS